jgi:uncharacterized protein with FMN-binding domain
MKRLILTVTGTAAGVAALLSFKTQTHPLANAGPLPSAGAAGSSATTAPAATSSGGGTASAGTGGTSSSATGSTGTTGSAPKSYTGRAVTTRYGVVQVKVTVADGKITDVAFVQLTAFDGHSQQINSAAAPQLLQETLRQQSSRVDTVSGATYTSDGYRESVQSALDQAGRR